MTLKDLSSETRDFLDAGGDLNDFAHEHADGCAEVNIYSRAHRLIADCSPSERARAEDDLRECGMESSDYDELATRLAYFIVRNRVIDLVWGELNQYGAEGEDVSDEHRDTIKKTLG